MILTIPLKGEYFDAIKSGDKLEEYRLTNSYWRTRLLNKDGTHKSFFSIIITKGYPSARDTNRRLEIPWNGFTTKTITHPHFGATPVEVFAINVSGAALKGQQHDK